MVRPETPSQKTVVRLRAGDTQGNMRKSIWDLYFPDRQQQVPTTASALTVPHPSWRPSPSPSPLAATGGGQVNLDLNLTLPTCSLDLRSYLINNLPCLTSTYLTSTVSLNPHS